MALNFAAVNKSKRDRVMVPALYTATVIHATSDSIDPTVPDCLNNGSQDNFARRSSDHHDDMLNFGFDAAGAPSNATNSPAVTTPLFAPKKTTRPCCAMAFARAVQTTTAGAWWCLWTPPAQRSAAGASAPALPCQPMTFYIGCDSRGEYV